ncbi:hypothetical protein IG631_05168 [Alternaria alternata]|nr:hypothetical protein IG631_05168 [Alternaria alternata]
MVSCLMLLKMTGLTFIDLPILHPFSLPIYIPNLVAKALFYILSVLRIVSWKREGGAAKRSRFTRYILPINYVTAPLAAVLFLLAATVIGKHELMLGTIGDDDTGICPYDLVIVFLNLGYIANSLGAAGLVRWMVLRAVWLGKVGHRLYLYLYICFFSIGAFLENDPIMVLFLSPTSFGSLRISNIHEHGYTHNSASPTSQPGSWYHQILLTSCSQMRSRYFLLALQRIWLCQSLPQQFCSFPSYFISYSPMKVLSRCQ